MNDRSLTIEQILTMLAAAPPRLDGLSGGQPPARLLVPPGPGEWSARDVLAHMRSCADVWGSCISVIIADDTPTIKAVNPRTWIEQTDYREQEFRPSLQAFAAQRTALLRELESLAPEGWARKATVTGAGKPLVRTVHTYAQWLAIHERPHIKQIERILNAVRVRSETTP